MAACTDNDKEYSIISPEQEPEVVSSDYTELLNKTTPVPSEYNQESALKGSVVQIDYDTQNYVEGNGEMRKNTAYVYLPYGYEEVSDQCYDVFYFVHGHGETAASFFQNEDGLLCKLLDHMIGNGDMAPTIVVSTSYVYGNPVDYYPDADPYCEALPQELVNDLIPIVESRYHTYTESTDIAGIKASREHRAIGGFSMGAVTTWYALEHTLDCFKYFMPISSDSWSLGRLQEWIIRQRQQNILPTLSALLLYQKTISTFGHAAERTILHTIEFGHKFRQWHNSRTCFLLAI